MRIAGRNVVFLGGAALVAMFTLVACGIGGVGATDDQGQIVLQSYDVPPEHRQEVCDMLQSALRGDGTYTLSLTTTGAAQTLGRRVRPPAPGHKDPSSLKQRRSPK